jgi:hypothetical protein
MWLAIVFGDRRSREAMAAFPSPVAIMLGVARWRSRAVRAS